MGDTVRDPRGETEDMSGSPAKILVADDDDAVRGLVAGCLRAAGYEVLEAATGDEALGHSDSAPDLLIADLVMPPCGGLELGETLRERVPGLAVLHISGYAPRTEFNGDASAVLLSKPFSLTELREHVEWLLAMRPPLTGV
jgi:CheY-like chemotaxis protein